MLGSENQRCAISLSNSGVQIETAPTAVHIGDDELPFVEIGNGNKLKVLQVKEREGLWIVENIFQDGEWAILEWKDPLGLRGCGFFHIVDGKIVFQRGYWDKLSFLRLQGLPWPKE